MTPPGDRVLTDCGLVTNTEACVSMLLSEPVRANWGQMVRGWSQRHGPLLDRAFPAFLVHHVTRILRPAFVRRLAVAAGLDDFDRKKMESFNRTTEAYRKRWQV